MLPERLSAGARTVLQIAVHFDELKQQAGLLLKSLSASQRGYFTPSEDEQARHLLVAYWQPRNALLELVLSLRDDFSLPEDLRPASFLIGYAGALVLVDAARFLRESVDELPIVRDKLNEPEPHFGIEAGTYDLVQRSLTSPMNAWHLYHAAEYCREHRADLDEAVARFDLQPVMNLVERLHARLDVALSRLIQTRLRIRAAQALEAARTSLLNRAIYSIQKVVSSLVSDVYTLPGHQPHLPGEISQQLRLMLQPGDVIVTRKDYAVTNYCLPGYWPHAALYLGDGETLAGLGLDSHPNFKPRWQRLLECDAAEPRRVLESMKDGVRIRSLSNPLRCDSLAVLRPVLPAGQIADAVGRAMFHEGKPYDFDFDFTRSDRLVCTEVVYRAYQNADGVQFELQRRAGRLTLSVDDILSMALRQYAFTALAVYAPALEDRLVGPDQAALLIRRLRPQL